MSQPNGRDQASIVETQIRNSDRSLVDSSDPHHPANYNPSLCANFYAQGWVTGTGGGTSIRHADKIYLAPSGVQKELIKPADIFVLHDRCMRIESDEHEPGSKKRPDHRYLPYLHRPRGLSPSACTPLFLTAFRLRDARCCIHTHSQWAVLVTLLLQSKPVADRNVFAISHLEQIKGIPKGPSKQGMLGYLDTLRVPIIENTPLEEDLTESLNQAILNWPDTYAVLVQRHGVYVWGKDVAQAKTICESLDYIWRLAVEMHKLGLPWLPETTTDGFPAS